uniref:Apical junction molecule ajm1 alpha/beta domain-containing protein n=1 Tax=Romanomermis culicivorax TaxID=13658 RepID=A0A915JUI6_ROMCU
MSNVAMRGYSNRGKGSVNFRFNSPFLARKYIDGGWLALSRFPAPYLNFYTVDEMVDSKKDPNLIKLCRLYDPEQKFVLSVSIIAEIEDVPETPVSERKNFAAVDIEAPSKNGFYDAGDFIDDNGQEIYDGQANNRRFERSRSVPNSKRKEIKQANAQKNKDEDTKSVLKSILRSMENIAPGPVYISAAQRNAPYGPVSPQSFATAAAAATAPAPFERNTKQRSTALGIEKSSFRATNGYHHQHNGRQNNGYGAKDKIAVSSHQNRRPCALFGESDLDETEV